MIASLRGALAQHADGVCVVEVSGVGYLVHVSSHTASSLPAVGQEVFLRTRHIVREDAVSLFGFADAAELELFDLLITVSGVGPRLALAVLSGLHPGALARAIRDERIATLVAIPGIGRKTAERLVVELRDKLVVPPGAPTAPEPPPARGRKGQAPAAGVLPRQERYEDAVAALVRLGYTAAQSQDAIRRVAEADSELDLEQIVRRALALLAKPTAASR